MKRVNMITVFILSIVFALGACKKGEEDNLLSLKSRKMRISGIWELSEAEGKDVISSSGNTVTTTYSFKNGKYTINESGTITTTDVEFTLEFDKKGAYEKSRTENNGGQIAKINEIGSWSFLCKNKDTDRKNKEFITFFEENTNEDYSGSLSSSVSIMATFVEDYELVRLTNKELIVRIKHDTIDLVNGVFSGVFSVSDTESEMRMTFKKK